jgi:ATP-dependent Clp protease adaptor protein ClpS
MICSTTTLPETDVVSQNRVELNPDYHVIFHNDDVTTMEFVVAVLMQVFQHPLPAATRLMLEVHHTGRAVVATLPQEIAEHRREQVHALARPRGFPLICTIEPA